MSDKKGLIAEFKEFVSRGSVIDMAVGVIMGSALTAIVNSLVNDVFMPIIGMLFGGIDFTGLKYVITPAIGDTPEAAIYYGQFIQNIVNFFLIAMVIFLMVKMINLLHKKPEEEKKPAEPTEEVKLLRSILETLKDNAL